MRSTLEAGGAGPYPARRALEMSGGEAASFCALGGPRSGLVMVIASSSRVRAEQGLAPQGDQGSLEAMSMDLFPVCMPF
jgi:hypothetical protein